jgi:hypothetical protein
MQTRLGKERRSRSRGVVGAAAPRLWKAAALTIVVGCGETGTSTDQAINAAPTLTLVRERNFTDLLPAGRYEGSGVTLQQSSLRVVFDNRTEVASIDLDLSKGTLGSGNVSKSQYEGITAATRPSSRLYVVKEIGAAGRGAIVTLDETGKRVATETTDISFSDEQKGLEGIAWIEDVERLLVLCEAKSCGAKGKGTGGGMIKSLRHESDAWVTEATLDLPAKANFEDYADLAVMKESGGPYRVAVISQESSALWLGAITMSPPAIADEGVVYAFPRDAGNIVYCSLEGVTFIDRDTFALVSDIPKDTGRCTKAEAVHVFKLP